MAEQPSSVVRAPLWPGPTDVAARLERLEQRLVDLEALRPAVESALVAQAARIETVLDAARRDLAAVAEAPVDAARSAADAVREEVARSRDLTADRLAQAGADTVAATDEVRAALLRVASDADDRLAEVRAAVAASASPTEALSAAVEALHARVDEVADQLAAHHEAQAARVEARLEQGTVDALAEVRAAGTRVVEDLVARLEEHATGLADAVGAVTQLQASLQQRLDDLAGEAALERVRLTEAFVEQLAGGLSKRERRRLAKRLEVPAAAEAVPATPTPEPDQPATVPPAAPADGDPTATDPATSVEPTTPAPAGEAEARLLEDDVPSWEATPPPSSSSAPPRPTRVRPSRRARPVRPAVSDPRDPAAVRRALAGVRGLGPARQSALIDRFGTLTAIREASDDELLEVRGIGPALLDGIREAARGGRD